MAKSPFDVGKAYLRDPIVQPQFLRAPRRVLVRRDPSVPECKSRPRPSSSSQRVR